MAWPAGPPALRPGRSAGATPRALDLAHGRAWQALGVALAGHGFLDRIRVFFAEVADLLLPDYPNLAGLLRTPTPAGPPILVSAFCYFFRREVETDDELARGLLFDGLRQLSASQARAFGEVGRALATLGDQFDA